MRSFERIVFLQALPYRFLVLQILMQKGEGEALAAQQNFTGSSTYDHLSHMSKALDPISKLGFSCLAWCEGSLL